MSERAPKIAKTPLEIQKAHDLLIGALFADGEIGLSEGQRMDVLAHASVLCWLLGHTYNQAFPEHLADLEEAMHRHGFVLTDSGELHVPPSGRVQ